MCRCWKKSGKRVLRNDIIYIPCYFHLPPLYPLCIWGKKRTILQEKRVTRYIICFNAMSGLGYRLQYGVGIGHLLQCDSETVHLLQYHIKVPIFFNAMSGLGSPFRVYYSTTVSTAVVKVMFPLSDACITWKLTRFAILLTRFYNACTCEYVKTPVIDDPNFPPKWMTSKCAYVAQRFVPH